MTPTRIINQDNTANILAPLAGKVFPPLDKYDEDRLIKKAQAGDQAVSEELFARYWGLIIKESHAPYLRNNDLAEDAKSVALAAFMTAIHEYDPENGVPFAPFAKSKVHYGLYDYFRSSARRWSRTANPEQDEKTGNGSYWDSLIGTDEIEDTVINKLDNQRLYEHIMQWLSPKEKELLDLIFLHELSLTKIGKLWNVSRQAVSGAKRRLLAKLRNYLLNDGLCPAG